MINLYDIAYGSGVVLLAPVWGVRFSSRHKVLSALGQRMGHVLPRADRNPGVMIHAVSLGEMNATRELVLQLQQQRPDLHVIVTTTTVTGYDRGRQLYGGKPNVTLVRYPLDFTFAINRFLDAMKPDLVVLMEGEIWPNFLGQCQKRNLPVVLVNGRVSESAYARYRRVKMITASMLRRISAICAQDQVYADRFKTLGAPADRVTVTGTMKFDTALVADSVAGDTELATELGLVAGRDRLWVCGSTGPGEELVLLSVYRKLLSRFPLLRLAIVPRKPERFDEVATLIKGAGFGLLRRSSRVAATDSPVILGDTMGELRKFYSLAEVVFVGRSLIDLGSRQWGSDMIEPAALSKPVVMGPWTHNFAEAVRSFISANAMQEVRSESALFDVISNWLENPATARDFGKRAAEVVRKNKGATARHAKLILEYLPKAVANGRSPSP